MTNKKIDNYLKFQYDGSSATGLSWERMLQKKQIEKKLCVFKEHI